MIGWVLTATEPDSMARAKELMDLIKSPTAVATGVLLVFAKQQLSGNAGGVRRGPTIWAGVATVGAIALAAVIVGVMTPLLLRIVFVNSGGIETRLLVYLLTWLVAIGTAIYAATVFASVVNDLGQLTSDDEVADDAA